MEANEATWQDFEGYVASLYRALGYRVSQNEQFAGQQIDIIAERSVPGIGLVKTLVECKHRSASRVSNQNVYDFIAMFNALRQSEGFSNGVVVTSVGFSKEARAAARNAPSVHLVTVEELEKQLFSLEDAFHSAITIYESTSIFKTYIPLAAEGFLPGDERSVRTIDNVDDELFDWALAARTGFVSILADFGSGKTTLLERLRYRWALEFVHNRSSKIPILFFLKELHRHHRLDDFISETLTREFSRSIHTDLFWSQASYGVFILLLDGFDEISSVTDASLRERYFIEIARLITSGSVCIMTCRPSYFVSVDEYNGLLVKLSEHFHSLPKWPKGAARAPLNIPVRAGDLEKYLRGRVVEGASKRLILPIDTSTIHLAQLNDDRINLYLQNFAAEFRATLNRSCDEIRTFLDSVYDVQDLMVRPILLSMIVETLLSGRIDIDDERLTIGPAALYEIYTTIHFDIEWHKGESRRLLSADLRRQLAEMVALKMGLKGSLDVVYAEILDVARLAFSASDELSKALRELSEEQVAADIQVCGFLSRHNDNHFRFTHKSFAEFFEARSIKRRLDGVGDHPSLQRTLSAEVLYFLGSFASALGATSRKLSSLLENLGESTVVRQNAAGALLFSGPEILGITFKGVELSALSLSRTLLRRVPFTDVRMRGVSFVDLTIEKSKWSGISFRQCSFVRLRVIRCLLEGYLESCDVGAFAAENAKIDIRSVGVGIRVATARATKISFSGNFHIVGGTLERCLVELPIEGAVLRLGTTRLVESTLALTAARDGARSVEVDLSGVQLDRCVILWLLLREADFLQLKSDNRLTGCRGSILITLRKPDRNVLHIVRPKEAEDPFEETRASILRAGYFWMDGICLIDCDRFSESNAFQNSVRREISRRLGSLYERLT